MIGWLTSIFRRVWNHQPASNCQGHLCGTSAISQDDSASRLKLIQESLTGKMYRVLKLTPTAATWQNWQCGLKRETCKLTQAMVWWLACIQQWHGIMLESQGLMEGFALGLLCHCWCHLLLEHWVTDFLQCLFMSMPCLLGWLDIGLRRGSLPAVKDACQMSIWKVSCKVSMNEASPPDAAKAELDPTDGTIKLWLFSSVSEEFQLQNWSDHRKHVNLIDWLIDWFPSHWFNAHEDSVFPCDVLVSQTFDCLQCAEDWPSLVSVSMFGPLKWIPLATDPVKGVCLC